MTGRRAALLLTLLCGCPTIPIDLDASYACTDSAQCGSDDYECCLGICRRVGTFDVNSCVPDAGPPDSGSMDSGTPDAGPRDSGVTDSGTPDSGTADSGTPDAGPADSGSGDAGNPDAGDGG